MKIRLLSYNIRYGGRGREELIAQVIRAADPDVVILQEATDPAVVERLSALTSLPNWDARYNHSTGFLSRIQVADHGWTVPPRSKHAFLEVHIARPEIRIFGLHLSAWFSKWSERVRKLEIQAILESIKEHQHGPHVIAGDFNALAPGAALNSNRMPNWIQAMVWLSGRDIARDTIQHMIDSKYLDVFRTLHPEDHGYTFPTWDPHVRLDYMFTPERYREVLNASEVRLMPAAASKASDHFPLLAELELPNT
ncbi:MAG TPA: endonuclease/exonuclease/phosphatase family protein [Longimicrobiales bacterium]|nr:endonuclease/exonuclease/phosphatase family protein [Longimicrobiales bacterium]